MKDNHWRPAQAVRNRAANRLIVGSNRIDPPIFSFAVVNHSIDALSKEGGVSGYEAPGACLRRREGSPGRSPSPHLRNSPLHRYIGRLRCGGVAFPRILEVCAVVALHYSCFAASDVSRADLVEG